MAGHVDFARADGELVCRARVATSFATRFRGLMGAAHLPRGEGLFLPKTSSIHTHFMRFPIDVVFLDADRRIVTIVAELRPWRNARARGAAGALELAAGECARLGLEAGAVLVERPAF